MHIILLEHFMLNFRIICKQEVKMNNRNYSRQKANNSCSNNTLACMNSCNGGYQNNINNDNGYFSDNYTSLAMVYTISQRWRFITDDENGLKRGTIFDELNKPFYGDQCKRGGCDCKW